MPPEEGLPAEDGGGAPEPTAPAASAPSAGSRGGIGKFVGQHKKPLIGGGVGAGIVAVAFGLTPLFGAFELLHIFSNELNHVRKEITMEMDKELNKITDKVIQRRLLKSVGGGPLAQEADKVKLKAVESEMENEGLDPKFNSDGDLTGLKDPTTGKELSESDLSSGDALTSNDALGYDVGSATQALDMGDRRVYLPTEAAHFGVDFGGVLPTVDDNKKGANGEVATSEQEVDKALEDVTSNGAPANEIGSIVTGEDPNASTEPNSGYTSSEPTDLSPGADASGPGGEIESAAKQAVNDFNSGTPSDVAIDNASDEWLLKEEGNAGDPIAPALMVCNLQAGVQAADKLRAYKLILLLVRHGNLLTTATSQLREGKVTAKGMDGLLTLLNGDNTAKTIKSPSSKASGPGSLPDSALSFSSSAAWQRATGGTVNSNTPELDSLANPAVPPKDTFSKIFTKVKSIPGENLACKAANSPLGFVFGVVATVGQFVLNGFDLGAEEIADIAANQAVFITFAKTVVPAVIKFITNLTITGAEDAVQWLNLTDAGLQLSNLDDYARNMGALPTSDSAFASLSLKADQFQAQQEADKPLLAQLFDTNDTNSAISRLAVSLPLNPSQAAVRGFASLMSNPLAWTKNFAALIPSAHADPTTDNPYHFVRYSFQGDSFDPIENENTLRSPKYVVTIEWLEFKGKQVIKHDVDVPAFPPLGDPATYVPGTEDGDTSDLLHCFVNNTTTKDYLTADSNGVHFNGTSKDDGICGSIGQFLEEGNNGNYSDSYAQPNWTPMYCRGFPSPCSIIKMPSPGDLLSRYTQYILDLNLMKNLSDRTAGVNP